MKIMTHPFITCYISTACRFLLYCDFLTKKTLSNLLYRTASHPDELAESLYLSQLCITRYGEAKRDKRRRNVLFHAGASTRRNNTVFHGIFRIGQMFIRPLPVSPSYLSIPGRLRQG